MYRCYYTIIGVVAAVMVAAVVTTISIQKVYAAQQPQLAPQAKAPIATSGDKNVYVSWWSNKTGNDEVMFKASADGGKTFGSKINLSNTPNSDSQDVQIAAAGNNVYVTWWERNQTANEPIMKVSNDNGKTFGEKIMLSEK
ncbi:MAG TPA: hypothetical protein VJ729_14935 [Nitrososphaeraceae archaeon]|nr:hypothetical protein [Nitrososphaeraceae archaeon]